MSLLRQYVYLISVPLVGPAVDNISDFMFPIRTCNIDNITILSLLSIYNTADCYIQFGVGRRGSNMSPHFPYHPRLTLSRDGSAPRGKFRGPRGIRSEQNCAAIV